MNNSIDRDKLIELLSDENILKQFPDPKGITKGDAETKAMYNRRKGAKWVRDHIPPPPPSNTESREVVDVNKLAEAYILNGKDFSEEGLSEYQNGKMNGFIDGYNQASSLLSPKDKEIEELRRWKREQIAVFSPLLDYGQKEMGLPVGTSITEAILKRLKAASQAPPVGECQHPFTTYDDFAMMLKCSDCGKHLPNTKNLTIEQAKDEVARKHGHNGWKHALSNILTYAELDGYFDEAILLYNTKQNNKP